MINSMFRIIGISLLSIALVGCGHGKKRSGSAGATAKDEKSDSQAEHAVRQTAEDERLAPAIQRDMNEIFFLDKRLRPGGLNAFSPERLAELETAMQESGKKSLRYYLENREYFDRIEDSGGGFRILANAKRLTPYRWTKAGRRKLFEMDTARVREMVANPCFSVIEDCGELASEATENVELLRAWVKKYPEPEYAADRDKLLREYSGFLKRYEDRVLKGVPRKARGESKGAKEASLLIGTTRKAVESLGREEK
jgi:hypothetical protein